MGRLARDVGDSAGSALHEGQDCGLILPNRVRGNRGAVRFRVGFREEDRRLIVGEAVRFDEDELGVWRELSQFEGRVWGSSVAAAIARTR
jgi:hypothetical protein